MKLYHNTSYLEITKPQTSGTNNQITTNAHDRDSAHTGQRGVEVVTIDFYYLVSYT
ncbi:MAG: hypothetical protein DDT27_01160 [Dehalococcoidia bacterium]|nr:hypothetical protein [Chloroflexota bacterium]MBT9162601.1 hypothetical protein [Chloroflexota bacterium]